MADQPKTIQEFAAEIDALKERIRELETFQNERTRAQQASRKSEVLFEKMLQGVSSIAIQGYGPDGTTVYWNRASERLYGYAEKEAIGKNLLDLIIPPEMREDVEWAIKQMAETGEAVPAAELSLMRKDGSRVPVFSSHVIVPGQDPVLFCIDFDLTEHKRMEEALRKSEARYRFLVDHSYDLIWRLKPDGVFSYVSPSWKTILGYEPTYMVNKAFQPFVHSDDVAECEQYMSRVLDARKSLPRLQYRVKHTDGSWRWHEGVITPVFDEAGFFMYFVGVSRDVTERKRAEEEREKLQAQLIQAQKLESIGTLAGGIAHDFNNLLMGILGHASLMMLDLDPSHPHYERLKHVEESVASGADLTRQLLGFARGGRYDVKPVSMNDIVEKSCAMFGRTKKEISIHRKYAKDPCVAEADRSQMEQVFMNLFVNAWQAMPGGGDMFVETEEVVLDEAHAIPGRVAPGRYVKVTVTDTGAGMDEQTKERIFDPFFSTKGMGRGTGLGLATVYGILHGHGGMITVESEPGRGSRFILYLPASEKDPVGEKEAAGEFLRGTETILLVDDEPMVMEVSRELLESLGYRVYAAGSGQEAVSVFMEKKGGVDLVILDMVMPWMPGGETFDRLREINPEIKVLLASGYSIDGQAQEIIDRGCNGFIQKPFRLKELSRRVREMLDD